MSKVTFRIDLEYNQPDFEFAVGETFESESAFIEAAKEYAIEDLAEYMRGYALDEYAKVIIGEEDSE